MSQVLFVTTTSTSMVINNSTMMSSNEMARYITQPGRDNSTDTDEGCCAADGNSDDSDSCGDEGSAGNVVGGCSAGIDDWVRTGPVVKPLTALQAL